AALQTIAGVEAAIEKADVAAADGVKNIGLLNDSYNNLAQAAAALLRQGALIDTFRNQETAVAGARAQFEQAQAEVQRLGRAMAQADQPTEELARSLQLAESKLQETGRALAQEETKLGELSRALRQAEVNTADLAGEQARLEAAATRASGTMERINSTLGRGGRQTNGLFGLKPNDLANLSFQLNDIFVSLASGQNPLIVLIQQGSQIGQLFPGLISTVARFAVAFSPLIIAAIALGAAFRELYTDSERLKQVQQDLANLPTGEALDPARYAAAQEKLEDLGASAEDARKAMMALAEEGFTMDQLEAYSEAASQLAERLGIDLTEATQMLVDVQQGGIEAVYDLTEKTNDLTDADLDHAEALFAAGKAAEARQFVLDRVAERNDAIAKATRSQWTPAVNNLKAAWQNFVGWLGSALGPFLDWVQKKINDAVVGLTFVSALLAGKTKDQALGEAFDVIRQQRGLNGPNNGAPPPGASDQSIRDRQYLETLDEELGTTRELTKAERIRRAETEARRDAQAAGVSAAVEERAVQQAIAAEQKKINEEGARDAKRSRTARSKADRERLTAQRQILSLQRQLASQTTALDREAARGPSASLEARLEAIDDKYKKIGDTITALRAKGITTAEDGTSLNDLEARVAATKERLKDEERIKFYQEQAGLLEKQRDAEIARVNDERKRGLITEAEALRRAEEINSRLSPQIVAAANQALAIARAVAGTTPSPEMVSLIASLERLVGGEANNGVVAGVGLAGLEEADKKLSDLTRERDELVRSYQTLNELGLQSDAETRDLTAQAYARAAEAQRPVIANLREQVELLRQTGIISETAYQTWIAKLNAAEAGLTAVDSRIAQINQAAMNGIAQGVTNAFNTVGNAIAGLINGTNSWGDALNSVLEAGIGLAASFLKAIADVLIQMVALQVAKSIIGGASGGLGGLFFHDGGVVGKGGSHRKVSGGSGSWIGAPKFHGGGGLGLKPDEYKAVLQRGEEVLTADDPRHISNIGKGGEPQQQSLKQVLVLDPAQIAGAMQGRAGQKTMLTFIRANKETIKQVLG
ncbi:MAG: phage tail length tape measure family protein, partial [Phycisphaerales bacterium]